jgi:dTDP-4-dehydrorhamnose reductase
VRLLVLGPDGQLGHDVVRAARDAAIPTHTLSRHQLDLASAAPDVAASDDRDAHPRAGPDPIAARLADIDFDVLINCAGYTRVDDAEADRAAAFDLNATAPGRLARACADRAAHIVHVSTDYVFDGLADRPYREDDPASPINVYGASKLAGEMLVRAEHPAGAIVVRTASLFGVAGARRAQASQGGHLVQTMIRLARTRGRLTVVDDIVMSPTATADVATAILHLLETGAPAGTYHVVNQGQASWYDFAAAIIDAAGIPAEVVPIPSADYPTPARRPPYSVLDPGKAIGLGCELRSWRDALEGYLAARLR